MTFDITKDQIVELNRNIVQEYGGTFGFQNEGNLDFLLAKLENMPDLFKKAAELVCGIIRGHPFTDGNKRTAFGSAKIFLEGNGISIKFTDSDVENFAIDIAKSEDLTIKEVEIWIREHHVKDGR